MRSYRETLTFNTKSKREYINITPQVQAAIDKSGIKEGLVLVNPMHITASCYINDDERGLIQDFDDFGTWEQIFYAEFDGQRPKRVLIKIIGE